METAGLWARNLHQVYSALGVGVLWVPYGRPLGALWVPSGCPMGALWASSGRPLGALWAPSGRRHFVPARANHIRLTMSIHSSIERNKSQNFKRLYLGP